MRRLKQKTFLAIIFKKQLTSLAYFVLVFVVYLILFYLASLSLLIETLKYLWPAIVIGGILIFLNFIRAWWTYKK
jgi:hypothetical protein